MLAYMIKWLAYMIKTETDTCSPLKALLTWSCYHVAAVLLEQQINRKNCPFSVCSTHNEITYQDTLL